MKTYRAKLGTVVKSKSGEVKFVELLYKTDKVHEQQMLEADKRVSVYGAKKVEAKKEVEVKADEVKTDTPKPKKKKAKKK